MPRTPRRRSRSTTAAGAPRAQAGSACSAGWAAPASFFRAVLLQPHPPHRFAEPRGPGRAGGEHSLSLAIPRRPDRCAAAKPAVDGEIIAGAIAASATVETNTITIDPDRLLDLKPGESYGPSDDACRGWISDQSGARGAGAARLVSPTKTRARIYDRDGGLILDSRSLYGRGDVCASNCRRRRPTSPGSPSAP